MARYCPECGIEILSEQAHCPLCQSELQENAPEITRHFAKKVNPVAPEKLSGAEIRRILFTSLSLMLGVGIFAVSLVNIVQGTGLSWARYAIASQAAVWALLGMGLYLYRQPLALLRRSLVIVAVFLLLLDSFRGGMNWSLQLALPVLLLILVLAHAVRWVARRPSAHWSLNLATVLGAVMLFCACLEWMISRYNGVPMLPGWSMIVALSLAPPAAFLLYVRYRLIKKIDLKKIFHR